jgi:hypothetical protein
VIRVAMAMSSIRMFSSGAAIQVPADRRDHLVLLLVRHDPDVEPGVRLRRRDGLGVAPVCPPRAARG